MSREVVCCTGCVVFGPCILLAPCLASWAPPIPRDNIAWGVPDHGLRFGHRFRPHLAGTAVAPDFSERRQARVSAAVWAVHPRKGPSTTSSSPSNLRTERNFRYSISTDRPAFNPRQADRHRDSAGPEARNTALDEETHLPGQRQDRPLPEMLALHYSVHASVDTSGDARWTRTLDQWMGKVSFRRSSSVISLRWALFRPCRRSEHQSSPYSIPASSPVAAGPQRQCRARVRWH